MSEVTVSKKAPSKKAAQKKQPVSTGERGSSVGYDAKITQDCRWNPTRVAFYEALRKIGGKGTATQISEASKGKVSVGNCLNYGYRGVAAGLNMVVRLDDVKGFTFVLTAKGKTIDLDKQLAKGQEKKQEKKQEKAK